MFLFDRLRRFLFGSTPVTPDPPRRVGTRLIDRIAHGNLRALTELELMELVDYLVTTPQLRLPLRGNTRFLDSVSRQYHLDGRLTVKQRQAIYNILERAYPHNLAAELQRFN